MTLHSKQTRGQGQEEKLHSHSPSLPGLAGKSSKARNPIGSGPQGLSTLILRHLGHQSGRIPLNTAEKLSCLGAVLGPIRVKRTTVTSFCAQAKRKALVPCGGQFRLDGSGGGGLV